jgi:hypothetical protein
MIGDQVTFASIGPGLVSFWNGEERGEKVQLAS